MHTPIQVNRSIKLFWLVVGIATGLLLPHGIALIELGTDKLQQLSNILPGTSDKLSCFSYQSVRKADLAPLAQTIAQTIRSDKHTRFLENLEQMPKEDVVRNYVALFSFDQAQCTVLRLFLNSIADFLQQLPTTYPLYKQYMQGTLGFNLPALVKLRNMEKQYEALSLFCRRLARTTAIQLSLGKRSAHPSASLQSLSNALSIYIKKTADALHCTVTDDQSLTDNTH